MLVGFMNVSKPMQYKPTWMTGEVARLLAQNRNSVWNFAKKFTECPCSIYPQRQVNDTDNSSRPMSSIHPPTIQPTIPAVDQMQPFQFLYSQQIHVPQPPRLPGPPPSPWHIIGTPQPIQTAASTSQQHLIRPPPPPGQPQAPEHAYREGTWEGYNSPEDISAPQSSYEYPRYREDQSGWVPPGTYYDAAVRFPHYTDRCIVCLFPSDSMNKAMVDHHI